MAETLSGEIDSETKVICKEEEGFTASCEQQKINSDGSTVVKVYYSRNTYSINMTLQNINTEVEPVHLKYGEAISAELLKPIIGGYIFIGWDIELPETMPGITCWLQFCIRLIYGYYKVGI